MTVGERIVYLRQLNGLTQSELARQAGLSRQCLYEYESDKADPKLFNAMCIADVLGVSLDYLARGETKKMKVRVPKSFLNLPESEKEKINEVLNEEIENRVNHNFAELQKIWLQLACIVLNRNFGFGKRRLLLFLGVWREMYRINNKLQGKTEQSAYLKAELNKIFGEGGYPYEYIDKLEDL